MQPIGGLEIVADGAMHSPHRFYFAGRVRGEVLLELHIGYTQDGQAAPCVPHLVSRVKDEVPVYSKLCSDEESANLSQQCARERPGEAAAALAYEYFVRWLAAEYPQDEY